MDKLIKEKLDNYGYTLLYDESVMSFKEINKMYQKKDTYLYEKALEFIEEFTNKKKLKVNKYAKKWAAKAIIVNIENNEEDYAETATDLPAPGSAIRDLYVIIDNLTDFSYMK